MDAIHKHGDNRCSHETRVGGVIEEKQLVNLPYQDLVKIAKDILTSREQDGKPGAATSRERTAKHRRLMRQTKDGEELAKARNRIYNRNLRARKNAYMKALENEIEFYKLMLGLNDKCSPGTSVSNDSVTDDDEREEKSSHRNSKPQPRQFYLPPKDELKQMTQKELSAWRMEQRHKRKLVANAIRARKKKERVATLEKELTRLKEMYIDLQQK